MRKDISSGPRRVTTPSGRRPAAAKPSSPPPPKLPRRRTSLLIFPIAGIMVGMIALGFGYWAMRLAHRHVTSVTVNVPRLEAMDCWFPIPAGRAAHCGDLVVAESRAEADGRVVRLRYVVLAATAPQNLPPIIYLNGGPGVATGLDADGMAHWFDEVQDAAWLNRQDVVLFDQRGVGLSTPALACPEMNALGGRLFTSTVGEAEAAQQWRAGAALCHDMLAASGLPLDRYNTVANADDLDDLGTQLGYERWRLYAVSYGTRLALEFLRWHAQHADSVILDSTYPPDIEAYVDAPGNARHGFTALFAACAQDRTCSKANPDLSAVFGRVVGGAASTPLEVGLPGGGTAVLDDEKLIEALFYGFYGWDSIGQLPSVITGLGHGQLQSVAPFAASAVAAVSSPEVSYGAFLASECHDEWGFNPPDAVAAAAGKAGPFASFGLANLPVVACPAWKIGSAGADTKLPVSSDVPILVLSGELDPITPPDWAVRVMKTLKHGFLIRFPGVGHGVLGSHACAERIAALFLTDGSRAPYDDCLLALSDR